jgi:Cytochrome C oxidase, cbb3-type, subunit III
MNPRIFVAASLVLACAGGTLTPLRLADAQQAPARDPTEEGKRVYKAANCAGCHKWHGNGGGGYGGDALSLRKTELTREQIIEVVRCGRPGTGMPFHQRGAYDTEPCYDMKREQVGNIMPPEAASFLRPRETEAVADYVIARVKGKGEPTFAECIAFFGEGSKVCGTYKSTAAGSVSDSNASPGQGK